MANLTIAALEKLREVILGGGNAALAEVAGREGRYFTPFEERSVTLHNISADLADQNRGTTYPAVYVYAVRMENTLRRKLGGFSGPVRLIADVRCTGERFENLERDLAAYVEAVTAALGGSAGPWGESLVYDGGYTVKFEPVKLGGRNFIQSAKIELEVEACG